MDGPELASTGVTKPVIFIGGGGHFRSVLDVFLSDGKQALGGILDDVLEKGSRVLGLEVIGDTADIEKLVDNHLFHVSVGKIGRSPYRKALAEQCWEAGGKLATVIASTAYVSEFAYIGEGAVIHHGAVVNAGASVGRNSIINSQALIEHDAVIGDHCHVSTGAIINGSAQLGDHSFVGSGAIVFHDVLLGEETIISAGAIVNESRQP